MNKNKIITITLTLLFGLLIILSLVKGKNNNGLMYQNDRSTNAGGPFELSNSSARYALTEAMVKNKSFFLSLEQAKFSAPDVVINNGKYTSIFTPGVSMIAVPFYYVGEKIGIPQITSYLMISLFGILNAYLVYKLSTKLGASFYSSLISGFVFLFASNALPYSLGFTQHNLSTAIVLLTVINAIGKRNWINNIFFGALVGIGIMIDIPNIVFVFPAGLYMLHKSINWNKQNSQKHALLTIDINITGILLGLAPFLMVFGLYNNITTGSYTTLAQSIGRADFFDKEISLQNSSSNIDAQFENTNKNVGLDLPFNTRKQINGLYILLISNQRSWLYYSPVILIGLLGFSLLFKDVRIENRNYAQIMLSIVILNIVMYAMFGDPYGGWAFGPRYFIPSAALLCSGLAIWLAKRKSYLMYILFVLMMSYSIFVNLLGSLTTSAIPPKVEAVHLSESIPYTYEYNWNLLNSGMSSSLGYDLFFKNKISTVIYFYSIFASIILFFVILNINYLKYEQNKN